MNIIMKPTAELIPYAKNAKVHDKKSKSPMSPTQ